MKQWGKKKSRAFWFVFFPMLVLIGSSIPWVYASLNAEDLASNDFQMSELKNTLTEEFSPPTISSPVTPGKAYSKKVYVTNSGNTSLFVRALVLSELESANGLLLSGEFGKEIVIDLGKEWTDGGDGYFYYLGIVDKGKSTSDLFTKVTLASNVDDSYIGAKMKIHIKSEAIIATANKYRDAWWLGGIPESSKLQQVDTKLQAVQME